MTFLNRVRIPTGVLNDCRIVSDILILLVENRFYQNYFYSGCNVLDHLVFR